MNEPTVTEHYMKFRAMTETLGNVMTDAVFKAICPHVIGLSSDEAWTKIRDALRHSLDRKWSE